jgi:hypothetical protein
MISFNIIAERNLVTARFITKRTQKVDGTAKQTKSSEISIRAIKKGKITAEWVSINNFFQF